MKKLYIFPILLLAFFHSAAQFAGGDGSSANPYQVSTPEQLSEVRNYLDSYFIQTSNLDLRDYDYGDGKGWMPIAGGGTTDKFTGHYDGQGLEIFNLNINRPDTDNVGLFGHIGIDNDTEDISITNIGLRNVDIKGARGVGALVGRVTSNGLTKVEYTYVINGSVIGDGALGGLVGSNNSYKETSDVGLTDKPEVSKSFSDVDVIWSQNRSGQKFGGLVGCTQKGRIINSYSLSSVTVDNVIPQISGLDRVGGLVGCTLNRGEVQNSYSIGLVHVPISNPTVTNVEGHIGHSEGNSVINCTYWDTETSQFVSSDGGTGYTTSEMKDQSNFSCFDFTTVWGIDPTINDGYPYLRDGSGGVLPVELIHFSAKETQDAIKLEWATASEKNNDFFTIERSFDGIEFTPIDIILGNGNSNTTINYDFLDKSPENGMNYYRLKQTDFDGKFEYSDIIYSEFNSKPVINVYPNPATNYVQLEIQGMPAVSYKVTDLNGRTILSGNIYDTNQRIDLENVPVGSYQGIIYDESGNAQYFKLLKTK
jgi:hypothetical protein